MSLIGQLFKDYSNLPEILTRYDQDLDDYEQKLTFKGKTLDQAIKEQCAYPVYFDTRRAELKILVKYFEQQILSTRGKLCRKYKDNLSLDVSDRILNSYVDNEKDYLDIHMLYLEVEELYETYTAIVEAFNKRGFALRDLTASRIAKIEQSSL